MYNLAQRANALFAFSTTVIFGLLGAIAFITLFLSSSPTAKIDVKDLQVLIYDYAHTQSEFAFVDLKIDADLTSLFNWNTKQLFVAVVAEYETKTHNSNQVVLWDTIIQSKEDAHIKEEELHNEYNFVDITSSFDRVNANYSIYWDIMPFVGVLISGNSGTLNIKQFPAPMNG
ncbi:17376_t:CDS:2, partial [Acaulospora morrowiae]